MMSDLEVILFVLVLPALFGLTVWVLAGRIEQHQRRDGDKSE